MRRTENRRKRAARPVVLLASMILLLSTAVGGTLAWLVDATGAVTNLFTPGRVSCSIGESFSGGEKSNVTVQNTGNVDAYIRARVVVTWKNQEGHVHAEAPVLGTDYTITWGANWQPVGEYRYFRTAVDPKGSTDPLIISCSKLPGAQAPTDYDLSVEILADAVQSEPAGVVKEVWTAWPF